MSNELKTSINILKTILGGNHEPTADALADLFEISNGNKEVMLGHFKAICNIFEIAIKELESDKE